MLRWEIFASKCIVIVFASIMNTIQTWTLNVAPLRVILVASPCGGGFLPVSPFGDKTCTSILFRFWWQTCSGLVLAAPFGGELVTSFCGGKVVASLCCGFQGQTCAGISCCWLTFGLLPNVESYSCFIFTSAFTLSCNKAKIGKRMKALVNFTFIEGGNWK